MKKTNKGFSMVELIIVIAIMAILAGALAPTLIKYISRSRISADITTGDSIAGAIQTALSNEQIDECTSASFFLSYGTGDMASGKRLGDELDKTVGKISGVKQKATKAVDGKKLNAEAGYVARAFYVKLNNDQVEVYAAGTNDSFMVYPTQGDYFNMDKK